MSSLSSIKWIILFVVILSSGCASPPLTTTIAREGQTVIDTIAVLPFNATEKHPQFEVMATRVCQTILHNHAFKITNEGDIRLYLQRKQLFMSDIVTTGNKETYADLAAEHHVDALVIGTIRSIDYIKTQDEPLPVIGIELKLLDAKTGQLLANSFLKRDGEEYRTILRFGLVRSNTKLIQFILTEIIDDWQTKGALPWPDLS